MTMVLVNGVPSEHVRVFDRGLMYGDGVFRTLMIRAGQPLCWSRHYEKLLSDCAALGIPGPRADCLTAEMGRLIDEMPDCVLKIIVTRGEGARGYAFPDGIEPTRILMTSPIPIYPAEHHSWGVRMHLCKTRLATQPKLAGIKHLNRLENVLARKEWSDPETAEGLLLDMEGNAIEGTMSNIFMRQGNTLYTPDLTECGVAGVQRDRIIESAGKLGMAVTVGILPLDRIYGAEELVLCNSVIGIWQVRELGDKSWQAGNLAARLRTLLNDDCH